MTEPYSYPDEVARKWKAERDKLLKVLYICLQEISGVDYGMKKRSKAELEKLILTTLSEVES